MNSKKQHLIDVFIDTENRVNNGEYNKDLKCVLKIFDKTLVKDPLFKVTNANGSITVKNIDCIEAARQLSLKGKTCMLNMASYKKPGGGVRSGAMAQEEELSRCSNLVFGLNPHFYPLGLNSYLYTENVTFFKDRYYQIVDSFDCDIITIAAVNLNHNIGTKEYHDLTDEKIKSMIYEPYLHGCHNLVLSAFGCGVFRNDPEYISIVFDRYVPLMKSLYDNVVFAILNDHNSVANNYSIFEKNLG